MGQRAPRPRISIYRNGVVGNIIAETGHIGIRSRPRQLDTAGGRVRNGGIADSGAVLNVRPAIGTRWL